MRKNLLSSIFIISLIFTPAISAAGWQSYAKKWGSLFAALILFSKAFPKQAKELGNLLDKNPLLVSLLSSALRSRKTIEL